MTQTIPIQFQGLQEGLDPKALPPGSLLKAENCRIDKARRIRKRGGTDALTNTVIGGGSISLGARLFSTPDGGLGCIDGTNAYVYVSATLGWRLVGAVSPWRAEQRPLTGATQGVACVDVAVYADKWLVSVWMGKDTSTGVGVTTLSDTDIFFQVQDLTTWALVKPPTRVGGFQQGQRPKVRILGNTATFFWIGGAGADIYASQLDLTTLTLGNSTSLMTGVTAGCAFDVATNGVEYVLFVNLAAGVNRMRLRRLSAALATVATLDFGGAITTQSNSMSVSCSTSGASQVFCTFSDRTGGNLSLATVAGDLSGVSTLTAALVAGSLWNISFAEQSDNLNLLVGYSDTPFSGGTTATTTFLVDKTTHAIAANTKRVSYGLLDFRRPVKVNGTWYSDAVVYGSDEHLAMSPPSRVLLEIGVNAYGSSATPCHKQVATLENMTGWFQVSAGTFLGNIAQSSDGTLYVPSMRRLDESDSSSKVVLRAACYVNKLSRAGDRFKMLQAGNARLLLGASPANFDGRAIAPTGFAHAPHVLSFTDNGAGTGSLSTGTYRYQACYVYVDAAGVEHRSILSEAVDCPVSTAANTCSLTVTFMCTSVWGKTGDDLDKVLGSVVQDRPVYIEIYRSTLNGETMYRRDRVLNDPTAASVTFTDTRADTDIDGHGTDLDSQPQPYTLLETDDIPPPASLTGTVHRNRYVVIDSSGHVVWASKDAGEDLEIAPGFNEAFVMQFARRKVACASLDEKLVLWGETDIHIAQGEGPDAAGAGGAWDITQLQSDVGCTEPRSVVVSPLGALFLSRAGLQLLSRDLSVSRLGKAVEDTLASFPYVTSAVLVESEHEVRFTCNNMATNPTQGIVLVWDYLHTAWFVRKYQNLAGVGPIPFADAVQVSGSYYLLGTDGRVYQETFAHFKDCGTYWVERDIQLAPFEPAGHGLGWSRVRDAMILTTGKSAHGLEVSVATDFASTWAQVETFAETDEACGVDVTNKARVTVVEQKCQALALRIRDTAPVTLGTGEGPIFEELAFRADTFRGPARASDGESR